MTTLDIAGLCERLEAMREWHDRTRDRETITLSKATLERQAAEIERLREELAGMEARLRRAAPAPEATGTTVTNARAALTGEDTATLSLSGKTQTREDACTS
jgi:type II secretory pathway component PulJ